MISLEVWVHNMTHFSASIMFVPLYMKSKQ